MGIFSLGEFALKLNELAVAVHEETKTSLEAAARIVEKEAKREIGNYQTAAAPFAGWAELADSTKEDRLRHGFTENDPGLRSGEMRNSISHDVEVEGFAGEAVIGSNAPEMVWFELGTSKQPPRSVLGGALVRKTDEVVRLIGARAVGALVGREVVGGAMGVFGDE